MNIRLVFFLIPLLIFPAGAASTEERIARLEAEVSELKSIIRDLRARLLGSSSLASSSSSAPSSQTHLVRSGETFWSISKKHGISVNALERANPRINPDRLPIGKRLTIPSSSSRPTPTPTQKSPSPGGTYLVKNGDILGRIAQNHGVSLASLLAANPKIDPRRLRIGSSLVIPSNNFPSPALAQKPSEPRPNPKNTQTSPPGLTPTVPPLQAAASSLPHQNFNEPRLVTIGQESRFGDIAARYNTTVDILNRLNDLTLSPEQLIQAGSQVLVPQQ